MNKLKFNPDNKKYYSEDFIKGFECGVERQFNADMVAKTTINSEKTTITDGDLISRQSVIDLLNKLIEVEQKQGTDVMNYGRERVNAYESILDEIESDYLFPSIPSAEKTAEWIFVGTKLAKCSNCNMQQDTFYGENYCPYCGSRMKGGVE